MSSEKIGDIEIIFWINLWRDYGKIKKLIG
jgi:hypothetical protein